MYAEKLGISLHHPESRTHSVSSAGQMINFSVLMWSKTRAVQRVILQVQGVVFLILTQHKILCEGNYCV